MNKQALHIHKKVVFVRYSDIDSSFAQIQLSKIRKYVSSKYSNEWGKWKTNLFINYEYNSWNSKTFLLFFLTFFGDFFVVSYIFYTAFGLLCNFEFRWIFFKVVWGDVLICRVFWKNTSVRLSVRSKPFAGPMPTKRYPIESCNTLFQR